MHALRRTRSIGRYFAVWLLFWFVAMSARPMPPLAVMHAACPEAQAESGAGHAGHHGHEGHEHAHNLACSDGQAADVHAGHAAGSPQHCPLCMHAAAPPPSLAANDAGSVAPADVVALPARIHVRVLAALPPPARAPPLLS